MLSDEKLLIDKINDLFSKCDKYCTPVFSSFLDEGELAVIEDRVFPPPGYNLMQFGGFEGASRRIYGVFPEWQEAEAEEFPVSCVRITFKFGTKLTHRDYLGSILGLGLERYKTGDIIVLDDGAYVFGCSDIAEYIVSTLDKIGRRGVKCRLCGADEIELPPQEFEVIDCVAASPRLDAVISAMLGISRKDSARLVNEERVTVNHRLRTDMSKQISEGDVLSVRGFGRFIFEKAGNNTRSGRIHIRVLKYV